jgi:hypothetical protein
LIVVAVALILEDYVITYRKQGQDHINVDPCAGKMADIDLGGAGLRTIIP